MGKELFVRAAKEVGGDAGLAVGGEPLVGGPLERDEVDGAAVLKPGAVDEQLAEVVVTQNERGAEVADDVVRGGEVCGGVALPGEHLGALVPGIDEQGAGVCGEEGGLVAEEESVDEGGGQDKAAQVLDIVDQEEDVDDDVCREVVKVSGIGGGGGRPLEVVDKLLDLRSERVPFGDVFWRWGHLPCDFFRLSSELCGRLFVHL